MKELTFIYQRRSVRRFTPQPVTGEQIEALLKAAMAAPSAMNLKPWRFVVVQDPERLEALRGVSPYSRIVAPLAICVCGDLGGIKSLVSKRFWVQDCSAATQNLLLAATALGLGAVWCGVHPLEAESKRVSKILNLPERASPLNVIFIGHPAEQREPRTQYDPKNVSWEVYGANPGDI